MELIILSPFNSCFYFMCWLLLVHSAELLHKPIFVFFISPFSSCIVFYQKSWVCFSFGIGSLLLRIYRHDNCRLFTFVYCSVPGSRLNWDQIFVSQVVVTELWTIFFNPFHTCDGSCRSLSWRCVESKSWASRCLSL